MKESLKRAKRNYAKKCKKREITFYLHEIPLYNFSKTINFSKLVKDALRKEASKNGNGTL